jgi:hypothetical protein
MPLIFNEVPLQIGSQESQVQEIVLYPVSEDVIGEISDDGTSPAYRPASAHSTVLNTEGTPGTAWSESVSFESEGTITVISAYYEFEWLSRRANGGANTASKIQVSGNGGSTWVDLTDTYTHSTATLTARIRAGVSNVLTTVSAGSANLQFRLVHWVVSGNGSSDASEAHVRSNSYIRITYRKT